MNALRPADFAEGLNGLPLDQCVSVVYCDRGQPGDGGDGRRADGLQIVGGLAA